MPSDRKNRSSGSLAAAASDQIRTIIEAAEETAAQIRADAEAHAAEIRRQAEEEASGIRREARGDVQALLDSLRREAGHITADLEQLEQRLRPGGESAPAARPAAATRQRVAPSEPEAPIAPAPAPAAREEPEEAEEPEREDAEPAGERSSDIESARLVALNMALDGADRDEIDRYLSDNFALADREALLDDVYASVGG